jgi:hypothetical protein
MCGWFPSRLNIVYLYAAKTINRVYVYISSSFLYNANDSALSKELLNPDITSLKQKLKIPKNSGLYVIISSLFLSSVNAR